MPDPTNESPAEPKPAAPTLASSSASLLDYTPPPPPTRVHRVMSAARRWARDTFSREQLVAGLKQLAWVAPLTILIWVYAEREQQHTISDVRFAVEVSSNDPKVHVRLLEPNDGYASADLKGPRSVVEKLRRDLGARMSPVRFEVPDGRKEGEHQFPLNFVLSRDPRFDGITVGNGVPRNVTVLVDPIVEETVQLSVSDEDRNAFEQIVFNPPAVKVRIPKRMLADVRRENNGKLMAYADLSALDRTPGRKSDISGVRVVIPHAPNAEQGVVIEPSTISVSLTVRQADQETSIKQIPIQDIFSTRDRNDLKVTLEQYTLFDVKVVGPPEAIRLIEQTKAKDVEAYVRIDREDIDAGPRQKTVGFHLPPGVKVKSVAGEEVTEDKQPTIEVTVENRAEKP